MLRLQKFQILSSERRYVQLPINARMREAWEQRWQTVEFQERTGPQKRTFMEAAARLGVGVFASAPLLEGQLLQDSDLQVIPSDLISRHLRGRLLLLMHLHVPFSASVDVVKM